MVSAATAAAPVPVRSLIAMRLGNIAIPRARSPYPERGDEKLGAVDFVLTQLLATFSSKLEHHAAKLAAHTPVVEECGRSLAALSEEELAQAALAIRGPLLRHGF